MVLHQNQKGGSDDSMGLWLKEIVIRSCLIKVTLEEIKEAVWDCGSSIDPGPGWSSKLIMVKKEVSIQMVVASRAFGLLLGTQFSSSRKVRLLFLQGTIDFIVLIKTKIVLSLTVLIMGNGLGISLGSILGVKNRAILCEIDARYRMTKYPSTLDHTIHWDKSLSPEGQCVFVEALSLVRFPHRYGNGKLSAFGFFLKLAFKFAGLAYLSDGGGGLWRIHRSDDGGVHGDDVGVKWWWVVHGDGMTIVSGNEGYGRHG
ncbi:hypothetical protein Tco_1344985 [Tanacetum coccineum]